MVINTKDIRGYYNQLISNEREIEKLYFSFYLIHQKRLKEIENFNKIYNKENRLRDKIESIIYRSKNLRLNQLFSKVAYYSKEMLFQKMDTKTLAKWENWTEKLRDFIYKNGLEELKPLIDDYADVVKEIGQVSLKKHILKAKEFFYQKEVNKLLKSNRETNFKLEALIEPSEKISKKMVKSRYYI